MRKSELTKEKQRLLWELNEFFTTVILTAAVFAALRLLKKKTKCYIYTRVSTAIQVDGYSLNAQKDKLKKYAEFQDMEIVGEYSDEGHSGKNIKGRQEFIRMLNDIEDGKDGVDFVLAFKLSRFGRNAADVLSSLQLMQDYGVNLICAEDVHIPLQR